MELLWTLVLICLLGPPLLVTLLVRSCDDIGTRRFGLLVLALALAGIGAVPPTVLAMLWYIRTTDIIWATSGPFPFSSLGGAPLFVWGFLLTGAATTTLLAHGIGPQCLCPSRQRVGTASVRPVPATICPSCAKDDGRLFNVRRSTPNLAQ